MESKTTARVGALCGVVCPVALSVGRDGPFMLAVLGLAAFVPFLAYICGRLRSVEPDGGWLWLAAFGAGLMGMTIKLMSGTPEIAYRGIPNGSQAHRALEGIANGATVVSLYPFAIFCRHRRGQSLRAARPATVAGRVRRRDRGRARRQRQLQARRHRARSASVHRLGVRCGSGALRRRDVAAAGGQSGGASSIRLRPIQTSPLMATARNWSTGSRRRAIIDAATWRHSSTTSTESWRLSIRPMRVP